MEKEMLETLRLVPDDVILAVATRDIQLDSAFQCVCGSIIRELWSIEQDVDFDDVEYSDVIVEGLHMRLGGEPKDWYDINGAFADPVYAEALELAFVTRLDECV